MPSLFRIGFCKSFFRGAGLQPFETGEIFILLVSDGSSVTEDLGQLIYGILVGGGIMAEAEQGDTPETVQNPSEFVSQSKGYQRFRVSHLICEGVLWIFEICPGSLFG